MERRTLGRTGISVPAIGMGTWRSRELLPLAEALGIGVFVMSPLQGGILDRRPTPAQLGELGVEAWAQAVLKWIASDPRVSKVLTATHRPERAAENAAGGEPPFFTPAQRALVERIAATG